MGYPAQVSGVIGAKFGCHGILGNPVHFPFLAEEQICVDVDLIDDASCLHGAMSSFDVGKGPLNGPASQWGLVQAGGTLSRPVQ